MSMDAAAVTALRKPFDAKVIGLLPKINCQACSKSGTKDCDRHKKAKCAACGNWITTAHIHLDFVGHASVTDRLLSVDPEWTWEPLAVNEFGLPAYDNAGNLWIKLTVCGVTRLGVGDGPDPKQRIGDALRNASMRFGVALDLWAKDGLESELDPSSGVSGSANDAPAGAVSSPAGDSSPAGKRNTGRVTGRGTSAGEGEQPPAPLPGATPHNAEEGHHTERRTPPISSDGSIGQGDAGGRPPADPRALLAEKMSSLDSVRAKAFAAFRKSVSNAPVDSLSADQATALLEFFDEAA